MLALERLPSPGLIFNTHLWINVAEVLHKGEGNNMRMELRCIMKGLRLQKGQILIWWDREGVYDFTLKECG